MAVNSLQGSTDPISKAIIDAKGDLIAGTADNTIDRLAAGSNGQMLMADSSATAGLRYVDPAFAGRNRIINGGFDLWQRATSYTINPSGGLVYGAADRWQYWHNGATAGTNVASREAFTAGQTEVPGEPTYFHRITTTTLGTGQTVIDLYQKIEDVRTFAGQTVTVSLYARSSNARSWNVKLAQDFGSGGSATVETADLISGSTSNGWTRYTATVTLPSISGKTIGANSFLRLGIRIFTPGAGDTHDIACVQVERGPVATPFEFEPYEATLRKCQRYCQSYDADGATDRAFATGTVYANNKIFGSFMFPRMRTAPSATLTNAGSVDVIHNGTVQEANNTFVMSNFTPYSVQWNVDNTGTPFTVGQGAVVRNDGMTILLTAEL